MNKSKYNNLEPNQYTFALHDGAIYISPTQEGLLYSGHFEFPHEEELTNGNLMESVWEMREDLTYKETMRRMISYGFVHDEYFQSKLIEDAGNDVEEMFGLIDPEDIYFAFFGNCVIFQPKKHYNNEEYFLNGEIPFRDHISTQLDLNVHGEESWKYTKSKEEMRKLLISFGYTHSERLENSYAETFDEDDYK
jgi:hypothetical protein